MTEIRSRPILAAAFVALVMAAAMLLAAFPARAQNGGIVEEQRPIIEKLVTDTEALQSKIDAAKENDSELVKLRLAGTELASKVLASAVVFRPRLSEINARLEQLGPPPANGQPAEPPAVTEERNSLLAEKASINELIGKAEASSIAVNRMIDTVNELRRELFARTLTRRFDINYDLAGETLNDFSIELQQLWWTVSNWMRFVTTYKLRSVLGATFFSLLGAFVLLVGGRRLFERMISPDPAISEPSYLSRLSVAFWSTLLPTAVLAVFMGGTYVLFDIFGVLRAQIDEMLIVLFEVIGIVFFVNRLVRAALSPALPNWRLVAVDTRPAYLLIWLVTITALVTGLDFLFTVVNDVMKSPLSLTVAKSLVATVIVGLLVILIGAVKPFTDEDGQAKPWPLAVRLAAFGLGGATIVAALFGYIGLARFVSQQIVISGAIAATMYIGFLSARAVSDEGNFARTSVGKWLENRAKVDATTLDQLGVVANVVINLLVVAIGIPLILLQWGFQLGDIRAWTYSVASEVQIGSVSISLIGIVTGLVVFVLAYFATRWFQSWIDGNVLKRGRFDSGIRNSIRTAVGYLGIALAALIGVSAAGIDLSSLALVAGALSLGIGFGLQTIVSNFVSGLILLAERPFKVGDWIIAGAYSGLVKKISVRATEIETFQKQTIILPNSELINAAVGNWTLRNHLGRVEIPVGVSYDSNPHQVRDLLLEIGQNHPLILKNPEPQVYFANFGASSLDFELRVHIADIFNTIAVQTELRLKIMDVFKEKGIEIPFPQQDVHIKTEVPPQAIPLKAPSRKKAAGARPASQQAKRPFKKIDPE